MEKQNRTAELITQAKLGDNLAWEELYKTHWTKVYQLCYRFNQRDAEDLAQDVMLQAFKKINSFEGRSQFSTWLYRIARNLCLMGQRRKQLPIVVLGDFEDGQPKLEGIPSWRNEERAAIARMDLEKIVPCIALGQRTVVILRDWLGYNIPETATAMGISRGGIKSQTRHGRQQAMNMLTGQREIVMPKAGRPRKWKLKAMAAGAV